MARTKYKVDKEELSSIIDWAYRAGKQQIEENYYLKGRDGYLQTLKR